MANLEQGFKIVGNLSEADREAVKKNRLGLRRG